MAKPIKIEVKPEDIIEAVKRMKKKEREAFLEADYRAGRVKSHEEVFGP